MVLIDIILRFLTWEPGAPWRSMMTFTPTCLAHPIAVSMYGAAPLAYGLFELSYAQKPIGIRTTLKPESAIF